MPRYFFIIQTPDHRYEDDRGTALPDDQRALSYEQTIIAELKRDGLVDNRSG
jgi:hypothetical protein